jgi:hypothetical protein
VGMVVKKEWDDRKGWVWKCWGMGFWQEVGLYVYI